MTMFKYKIEVEHEGGFDSYIIGIGSRNKWEEGRKQIEEKGLKVKRFIAATLLWTSDEVYGDGHQILDHDNGRETKIIKKEERFMKKIFVHNKVQKREDEKRSITSSLNPSSQTTFAGLEKS